MYKYIISLLVFDVVVSQILNLREGKPCEWQERSGKCALVHKCRSAKNDIKAKNYPPICSFEGKDPIVCCTDCKLTNDTRPEILVYESNWLVYRIATHYDRKCEEYENLFDYPCKYFKRWRPEVTVNEDYNCNDIRMQADIFNQTLYDINDHRNSHLAYLFQDKNLDKVQELCAGSIISERFILTTAECVLPDPARGQVMFVYVGLHSISAPSEDGIFYNVKRAIPHPEYKAPSKYHNIALLETDDPITFGPNVLPACLKSNSGFGRNTVETIVWTDEGINNRQKNVLMHQFDEFQCQLYYPPQANLTDGYNHTTQMCYGLSWSLGDSCKSSDGFPLQGERMFCAKTILGVTSFKRQCGSEGSSGLFTRVFYYLPWIESIVWRK